MNRLMIIGNLTRDPEARVTSTGKEVCSFTVAVKKKNDEADFFKVSAWGDLGANCKKYLSKGKKVCVVGAVSVRPYKNQRDEACAELCVTAGEVEFLSQRGEG